MIKKQWIALASAMMIGLSCLVGCGNSDNSTQEADTNTQTSDDVQSTDQQKESTSQENEAQGSGELNIFTWATYFPDDILEEFEQETGIKINYTYFTTNEEMLAKLEATNGADYDIVLASDLYIDIAIKQGLVAQLDKEKIPNYENINAAYLNQYYDPGNQYVVPYSAGTPLIIYDPARVDVEITGYESLWDPALADSIVMMDDARNVIGITLRTLGLSMNETDDASLESAREKLLQLKPNIRSLNYNDPQTLLISGDATVGYVFTSQIVATLAERPDMKVVYPEEGLGWGIDSCFIPSQAPNSDNAHAFLNFILDGERGARISEQIGYMCCNKAAETFFSEEYRNNTVLNIPDEALVNSEMIMDVGTALTKYDEIWVEFKQ